MYLFILANALVYILYGSSSPYKNINSNANNNVNIRNVSFFLYLYSAQSSKNMSISS